MAHFDLFHYGHINLLKYCHRLAGDNGRVIVSLNTDEFIQRFKQKPPIMSYKEREACLLGCKYVTEVVPNIGGADSRKTIEKLRTQIDLVVIGSDWHAKDYLAQMKFDWEWLKRNEIGLCYVAYTDTISTTKIKERLSL